MRSAQPSIRLIASPQIDWTEVMTYLYRVGGSKWVQKNYPDSVSDDPPGENLVEIGGRLCYRSWVPEINPNVKKVREERTEYLDNILASGHGSVLEHAHYTFIFHDVSRVFTHELVRHRHENISQESMRFVRLTDLPFWYPEWAEQDAELWGRCNALLEQMEDHQLWMAEHFGLDAEGVPFSVKKAKTSFMRRFAPDGVATSMVWTANIRGLRHIITMRTARSAEEEIRLVFDQVANIMVRECPALFGDFERDDEGTWAPTYRKV